MNDDLYQELIVEYAKKGKHKGSLGEQSFYSHVRNPLCGDNIELWIEINRDKVGKVRFGGHGCIISQASAAMAAELVEGCSLEEVYRLETLFRGLMDGKCAEHTAEEQKVLGDLVILQGVSRLPARIRCALLVFEAIKRILEDYGTIEADG